jgi:hypothetical protein
MKYTSEQTTSAEKPSKIADISAILGITSIVIFTMELAVRETTSDDARQALFAILAIAILAAIKIFTNVTYGNSEINRDPSNQDIESIVNLYGGTYHSGGHFENRTSVENRTQVHNNLDFKVPDNYFDVVKTIEQVPASEHSGIVSIREVLIRLHSYIETEPNLSVEQRKIALDKVKEIAIHAIANPYDKELQDVTLLMIEIDNMSDLWSQIIIALITPINIPALKLMLSVLNSNT